MIKKGLKVKILTGRDKKKEGEVIEIDRPNNRVKVQGINIVKKHTKANPNIGSTGGILEKEMPIEGSNLALLNPATGKGEKVGIKVLEDGRKVRVFKSNGEVVGA